MPLAPPPAQRRAEEAAEHDDAAGRRDEASERRDEEAARRDQSAAQRDAQAKARADQLATQIRQARKRLFVHRSPAGVNPEASDGQTHSSVSLDALLVDMLEEINQSWWHRRQGHEDRVSSANDRAASAVDRAAAGADRYRCQTDRDQSAIEREQLGWPEHDPLQTDDTGSVSGQHRRESRQRIADGRDLIDKSRLHRKPPHA